MLSEGATTKSFKIFKRIFPFLVTGYPVAQCKVF